MSRNGNIHLEQSPKLEEALCRLKANEQSALDLAQLEAKVADLLEASLEAAVSALGEVSDRALGAVGAYRVLLSIIRDADGQPPAGSQETPPDLFPEDAT